MRTSWCWRCTTPMRSTRPRPPSSCTSCRTSRGAPACPCRASISWTIRSPIHSQPAPTPTTRPRPQPNAFATGRNPEHAAVAATTGLLQMLSREEIAGVIAHELAHVRNHDTLTMTITATIAGAISMLAQFGLFFGGSRDNNSGLGVIGTLATVILAPIAAMIVQMAISRTREYAADELGARTTGRPDALASALARISAAAQTIENPTAERTPATAHLFIVNPLSGQRMDNLFSTHPSTENRIAALERLAADIGSGGYGPRPRAPPHPPRPPGPLGSPRARGENPGPREQNYLLSLRPNLP